MGHVSEEQIVAVSRTCRVGNDCEATQTERGLDRRIVGYRGLDSRWSQLPAAIDVLGPFRLDNHHGVGRTDRIVPRAQCVGGEGYPPAGIVAAKGCGGASKREAGRQRCLEQGVTLRGRQSFFRLFREKPRVHQALL